MNPTRKKSLNIIEKSIEQGVLEPRSGSAPSRAITSADAAYNRMVREILRYGTAIEPEEERTGTGTIRRFGLSYVVDTEIPFPIITTKKVNFESVVAEYLWFLSGNPSPEKLKSHTSIWNEWTDDNGHLETAYGRYWRNYPFIDGSQQQPGEAINGGRVADSDLGSGIDQIKTVVEQIKKHPFSRRHLVTAWHPGNAHASRLPPCHHSFVFFVEKCHGQCYLNMELNQRSGDMALGVPFNMSGYAMLLHLVADEVEITPGKLKHNITDAHIYLNHAEDLARQITRRKRGGAVTLNTPNKSLYDLSLEDVEDFSLTGYKHHDPIHFDVAV